MLARVALWIDGDEIEVESMGGVGGRYVGTVGCWEPGTRSVLGVGTVEAGSQSRVRRRLFAERLDHSGARLRSDHSDESARFGATGATVLVSR